MHLQGTCTFKGAKRLGLRERCLTICTLEIWMHGIVFHSPCLKTSRSTNIEHNQLLNHSPLPSPSTIPFTSLQRRRRPIAYSGWKVTRDTCHAPLVHQQLCIPALISAASHTTNMLRHCLSNQFRQLSAFTSAVHISINPLTHWALVPEHFTYHSPDDH